MSEIRRTEIRERLKAIDAEYQEKYLSTTPHPEHVTKEWPAEKRHAHDALWAEKEALERELRELE